VIAAFGHSFHTLANRFLLTSKDEYKIALCMFSKFAGRSTNLFKPRLGLPSGFSQREAAGGSHTLSRELSNTITSYIPCHTSSEPHVYNSGCGIRT
jgi:hypothetical protein